MEAVKQLKPEEKSVARRALDERAWSQRADDLLARVWARVEQSPLSEADIHAEVEIVRQTLYAARRN